MSKFGLKFSINVYALPFDDCDSKQKLDNVYLNSDSEDEIVNEIVEFDREYFGSDVLPVAQSCVESTETKLTNKPKWEKYGTFTPQAYHFDSSKSGFRKAEFKLSEKSTILDFFEAFVTPDLLRKIAHATNLYWDQFTVQQPTASKNYNWTDTDVSEMYVFLALTMGMLNSYNVKDFWDKYSFFSRPSLNFHMSYERYSLILKMLHFSINEDRKPKDCLLKIRMPLEDITNNFKNATIPNENLAIDASFVLWEEPMDVRQFHNNHPQYSGLKVFALVDIQTDFIVNLLVYTGIETEFHEVDSNLGISGNVVNTLMEPFLYKGYKLFINSLYVTPLLAKFLLKKYTNMTGSVKENRYDIPKLKWNLKAGQTDSNHTDTMLVIKTKYPGYNYMLTTQFEDRQDIVGKPHLHGYDITKPLSLNKYIEYMKFIDNSEALLCPLEVLMKNLKWYKKLFFHLIDLCLLNAFSSYKTITRNSISLIEFHCNLIHQILKKYSTKCCAHHNGDSVYGIPEI
ncbi:PiggyBac transposable element-derived protein [Cinara cedri]|uniref:PiggyBac transposable element-derived protein n=1 Tax=Cinara cedri TaxID=506608 RepID=A0A5E4MQ02_9HEMI|nr:PiggyBac transposable element-derived protein [Cinara cedri]